LKISGLNVYYVGTRTPEDWSYPIIKIETDEGISGVGECPNVGIGVFGAFKQMKNYLVGKDPFNIEKIRLDLRGQAHGGVNPGPVWNSAFSAVEIALWDIKGKALETPLYNLIGGRVNDKIRVYSNGWFIGCKTPDDYGKAAEMVVEDGFTALKFYPVGFEGERRLSPKRENEVENIVKAVRDAVGNEVDIMVDGGKLELPAAIKLGRRLEKYHPLWLEEPVAPGNAVALASVARSVDIPIAAGENLWTKESFREHFEKGAFSVVQPDVGCVGGIFETLKIAAMADSYLLPVAPHNPNGPILGAATAHLGASLTNFMIMEFCTYKEPHRDPLWLWDIIDFCYEKQYMKRKDGYIEVMAQPGLGVELNEDVAEKHVNLRQVNF